MLDVSTPGAPFNAAICSRDLQSPSYPAGVAAVADILSTGTRVDFRELRDQGMWRNMCAALATAACNSKQTHEHHVSRVSYIIRLASLTHELIDFRKEQDAYFTGDSHFFATHLHRFSQEQVCLACLSAACPRIASDAYHA
jgi:hypothetical protein